MKLDPFNFKTGASDLILLELYYPHQCQVPTAQCPLPTCCCWQRQTSKHSKHKYTKYPQKVKILFFPNRTKIACLSTFSFLKSTPNVFKMSVSTRDPATNQLEEYKKKKGVSYVNNLIRDECGLIQISA